MKSTEKYLSEIREIRKMMEESSRFLSLSGLSGILVGIYALVGAFLSYQLLNTQTDMGMYDSGTVLQLTIIATVVLILSFVTILILTSRRTKKAGKKIWNASTRLMMINLSVPLLTGGILILIFLSREYYEIIFPSSLIFYGLALVNAAKFTRQEIFYMGIIEISLGILAALFSSYSLVFWALGFGILHIVYGTFMYFRYEYKTNE